MRLFIAEKPSLGRAIAEGLGGGSKQNGHIVCGNDVVTWCFGHLLELDNPDDYDESFKIWKRETLPIIPEVWRTSAKKESVAQLKIIGILLKKASLVVHAGDPDREGQLLVDEVLEYHRYTGPAQRIWLAALDDTSVKKALNSLRDNADYAPLRDAARARSQADWLVGMNCTRAMTLVGRTAGGQGVLSQGRVQTPTLALVVHRDLVIENFKPQPYFVLQGSFEHENGVITATYQPESDTPGLDDQGRLIDGNFAEKLTSLIAGRAGIILSATSERKSQAPDLPFNLSSLQKAASSAFGMSAQEVLDTAQSLYEKKLTTYPRSDCRYLPEEQFSGAGRILTALGRGVSVLSSLVQATDPSRKSAAWNSKKITAHHAIIPTGEIPCGLSSGEESIYLMISRSYCLQFLSPLEFEARKIFIQIEQTTWKATGRLILNAGWTEFAVMKKGEEEAAVLPLVKESEPVSCTSVDVLSKKTTPPPRFTEGTLIEAMANVHRFIDDENAKKTLKENEGIGTEATRANILETLKKRGMLSLSKKAIISSPLGRQLISMTPSMLKDPVTTAQWESRLTAISEGKDSLAAFMSDQVKHVPQLVENIFAIQIQRIEGSYPCPVCQKPMRRMKSKEGNWYWGCWNIETHAKPVFLDDKGGKPVSGKPKDNSSVQNAPTRICPECKGELRTINGKFGPCMACFNNEKHESRKPRYFKIT